MDDVHQYLNKTFFRLAHKFITMKSIAELLDQAALLPINSPARREIEIKILEETGITNMNQLATFVEALGIAAALETRRSFKRLLI